ncbi:exosortase A, partial [Falsiroseomonas selenitidurans]
MTIALTARQAEAARQAWTVPLAGLGLGLLALGIGFRAEIAAAIATWDRSAAYTHCWLVLPIALWLAWQRRARLAGMVPLPAPLLALPALAGALAWLMAERLGIMEGRQLVLVGLVWVLVTAVLGWRIALAMAAPLAYLVFLVPFGEFATPLLQDITLRMILFGLRLWGIPHYADGLVIEIPAGTFLVAEACAGLRFLIAALAFGALYALVMFRSPGRRLLVMLLALLVPILANGVRAFGIVLLGHYLGSAEAAAADHLVYGWVFFSVVLLLLVVAGLPFRQDGAPAAAPRAGPRPAASGGLAVAA